MKTLFSNSNRWIIFRYLCLLYLFLCGLAWIYDFFEGFFFIWTGYASFIWPPVFTLGFSVYCIVVAIRTKLKTPRSKWLIAICAFVLFATLIGSLRELSRFDSIIVYFVYIMAGILFDDYWWYSSLWYSSLIVSHIVLFLYILAFNVYSLCTKFSLKESKACFFVSVASVVLLLCIGSVTYFNNSKDNNSSVEPNNLFPVVIIPDFDEIIIQQEE